MKTFKTLIMKKSILTFVFILAISLTGFSQLGVNSGYNVNNAANWKINNGTNLVHDFYPNNFSFGIDYWFRLPNRRVEFTPEINFNTTKSNWSYNNDALQFNTTSTNFSFFANTNFYIFDFKGDCDCPTFSKKGPELQKGFFFRISPGVSYFTGRLKTADDEFYGSEFAFSIGAGVGIDFGISDFVTLSPIAMLRYYPEIKWGSIAGVDAGIKEWEYPEESSPLTQIYLGLRLGIRFDYR